MNFLELRGYSRHFVKKEINRARIIPLQETLKPQPQNKTQTELPLSSRIVQLFLTFPSLSEKI